MTLTSATQKALDDYGAALLGGPSKLSAVRLTRDAQTEQGAMVREAELALLSVVAAEEGRKYEGKVYTKEDAEALCEVTRAAIVQHYEELVKLHREWVEAKNAPVEAKPFTVAWNAAYDKYRRRCIRAESALAQWEAK